MDDPSLMEISCSKGTYEVISSEEAVAILDRSVGINEVVLVNAAYTPKINRSTTIASNAADFKENSSRT